MRRARAESASPEREPDRRRAAAPDEKSRVGRERDSNSPSRPAEERAPREADTSHESDAPGQTAAPEDSKSLEDAGASPIATEPAPPETTGAFSRDESGSPRSGEVTNPFGPLALQASKTTPAGAAAGEDASAKAPGTLTPGASAPIGEAASAGAAPAGDAGSAALRAASAGVLLEDVPKGAAVREQSDSPTADLSFTEVLTRTSEPPRPLAPPASTARPSPAGPPPAPDPAQVFDGLRLALAPARREATLTLQPAELGRIRVRIEVDGGTVRALVRADHESALHVLQRHLPELRASLEASGLEPQELDVALFERGADPRDRRPVPGRRRPRRSSGAVAPALDAPAAPSFRLRAGIGLDTYA